MTAKDPRRLLSQGKQMGKHSEPFPVQELRRCFDLVDGVLVWKVATGKKATIGKAAGSGKCHKYCLVRLHTKSMYVHRVVYTMVHGEWPDGDVDHIDGNPQNNHPDNLRLATRSQNLFNSRVRSRNSSGRTGVSWAKHVNMWVVRMMIRGKNINFGYHKDYEFACFVREIAEDKYQGEYKWRGQPCQTQSS